MKKTELSIDFGPEAVVFCSLFAVLIRVLSILYLEKELNMEPKNGEYTLHINRVDFQSP